MNLSRDIRKPVSDTDLTNTKYSFKVKPKQKIMAVGKKVLELQKKREKALLGGGELAIEKQKAMGKRTARERIMALLDDKSFDEYDMFVEHVGRDFDMEKKSLPSDGVIIGTGTIYGAPVAIFAQDFTVAGGSLG